MYRSLSVYLLVLYYQLCYIPYYHTLLPPLNPCPTLPLSWRIWETFHYSAAARFHIAAVFHVLHVADSRLTNQSVAGIIYCAVGGGMSQYFAKNRLLGQTNRILIQPSSCSNTQHTAVLYYRPKLSLSNQCSVFVFKFWCYLLLFQSAWLMFHLTFLDILVGKYLVSLLTGRILLHI